MISRITGTLIEKSALHIVVDCHGLGYSLALPMSTFEKLPEEGTVIHLFTEHIFKEDIQLLFGFSTLEEREIFRELIKINSIGPKLALAILSTFSITELYQVIENNDVIRLTSVPKVGKKTAERLLIELKDRVKKINQNHPYKDSIHLQKNDRNDLINALISLGYSPKEAQQAFNKIELSQDLSKNIRLALKHLS